MDVILGWLTWGDEAFKFHGPVYWGDAEGHRSKTQSYAGLCSQLWHKNLLNGVDVDFL